MSLILQDTEELDKAKERSFIEESVMCTSLKV